MKKLKNMEMLATGLVAGIFAYAIFGSLWLLLILGLCAFMFVSNKGGQQVGQVALGSGAGIIAAWFVVRIFASVKFLIIIALVITAVVAWNWYRNRDEGDS